MDYCVLSGWLGQARCKVFRRAPAERKRGAYVATVMLFSQEVSCQAGPLREVSRHREKPRHRDAGSGCRARLVAACHNAVVVLTWLYAARPWSRRVIGKPLTSA